MKFFLYLSILLFSINSWALSIASYNLQFYGIGGDLLGKTSDEYRDSYIREIVQNRLPDSDVVFFEEVVSPDRLMEQEILPAAMYRCETYQNERQFKHQHIVVCYKKELNISVEYNREILMGHYGLRPLVIVSVKNSEQKTEVKIVGVHLKSAGFGEDGQAQQREQLRIFGEWIKKNKPTPLVLIGDFNSHLVEPIFNGLGLDNNDQLINMPTKYPTHVANLKLDKMIISKSLQDEQNSVWSLKSCSKLSYRRGDSRLYKTNFYRRFVSDHCPVRIDLPKL